MQKFWQDILSQLINLRIFLILKREEILNDLKDLDGIGMTQIQSLDSFF